MKVVIIHKGFDYRKIANTTLCVAGVGAIVAAYTADDVIYLAHVERIPERAVKLALPAGAPRRRRTVVDNELRTKIKELALQGIGPTRIAATLGIGYKTAERYSPGSYASQAR